MKLRIICQKSAGKNWHWVGKLTPCFRSLLIRCVMSSCVSHLATIHESVFFLIQNKIPARIYSSDNSGIRWIPAEGNDLCQRSGLWEVTEKTQIRVCYRVICEWWGRAHLILFVVATCLQQPSVWWHWTGLSSIGQGNDSEWY